MRKQYLKKSAVLKNIFKSVKDIVIVFMMSPIVLISMIIFFGVAFFTGKLNRTIRK